MKNCLAGIAALSAAMSAAAQVDEGAWRVESLYASSYVFRGVERANASAQATIDYSRGDFRVTAWTNHPFSGRDETREFSVAAAYSFNVSAAVLCEMVATHAWYGEVSDLGVDRSFEVGLRAALPEAALVGFTPSLAIYHDFCFEADTAELSFARSVPLEKLGTFLEFNLFTGWTAGRNWRPGSGGANYCDGYGYWGGEVRVPYRIGRFGVIAGLHYASTTARSPIFGPLGLGSAVNLWGTLGASLEF